MNYIQPNINMSAADFGFQQLNSQKSEKSFADLSFADALKAAYKNDRFASESSKIAKPEEKSESRVEEKNAASEKSPSEVKKDEVAMTTKKSQKKTSSSRATKSLPKKFLPMKKNPPSLQVPLLRRTARTLPKTKKWLSTLILTLPLQKSIQTQKMRVSFLPNCSIKTQTKTILIPKSIWMRF